jgi:hypothetical protein
MQFVSAGKGLIAGTVSLGIEDGAKVTGALKAVCAVGKAAIGQKDNPVSKMDIGDSGCKGELSFAMLEKELGFKLPVLPFDLKVEGKVLLLSVGEVDPARLAGNAADDTGSAETRAMLSGPASMVAWSRAIDIDIDALPAKLVKEAKQQDEVAMLLDAMTWLATSVYEIGFSMSVEPDSATAVLRVTTFAGDPADARSGYAAALDKRRSGDRAGYSAALGDLAKKFAGTRIGRRAKLESEGSPVLGPGSGLVAGGAAAWVFARKVRDFEPVLTAPAEPAPPEHSSGDKPGFGGAKKDAPTELKAPPAEELKAPPATP